MEIFILTLQTVPQVLAFVVLLKIITGNMREVLAVTNHHYDVRLISHENGQTYVWPRHTPSTPKTATNTFTHLR